MNKMLTVGITGRSGSGKSSVAAYYISLGYPAVDSDRVSREVTEPGSECLAELVRAFGTDILAADGTLCRGFLAQLAFQSPESTARLVAITHPYIVGMLLQKAKVAQQAGATLFFVDGAVIVGGAFEEFCDKIIVVTAQHRLAVSRIILRDGISKTAAASRLSAQLSEKKLCDAADYIIQNNVNETTLQRSAHEVLQKLLWEVEESG